MKRHSVLILAILAAGCGGSGGIEDQPAPAPPVAGPAPAPAPAPGPTPPEPEPAPPVASPTPPAPAPGPTPPAPAPAPPVAGPPPAPRPPITAPPVPVTVTAAQVMAAIRNGVPLIPLPQPPGGPRDQQQWLYDSTRKLDGPTPDNKMWIRTILVQDNATRHRWQTHLGTIDDSELIAAMPYRNASIDARVEGQSVSVDNAAFVSLPPQVPLGQTAGRWELSANHWTELLPAESEIGPSHFSLCWSMRRPDQAIVSSFDPSIVIVPAGPVINRLVCSEVNKATGAVVGATVTDSSVIDGNGIHNYRGQWGN